MNKPAISDVFGIMGALCWSVQLIPQIILNYRRKNVEGLDPRFMMVWTLAGAPLAIHNLVLDLNIALRIQPQILTTLSLVTWVQCRYYGSKWSLRKCAIVVAAILIVIASIEAGLVIVIREAMAHGCVWPTSLMGVLAGAMLCAGVGCEYYSIWRYKTVDGISFLFCAIDAVGDVMSIISVVFEETINFYSIGLYAAEFVCWCGIFGCGLVFKVLPWVRKRISRISEPAEQTVQLQIAPPHGEILPPAPTSIELNSRRRSSTSVFRTASAPEEPNLLRQRVWMHGSSVTVM